MSLSPEDYEKSIGAISVGLVCMGKDGEHCEEGTALIYLDGHMKLSHGPCGSDGWGMIAKNNQVYCTTDGKTYPIGQGAYATKILFDKVMKIIDDYNRDKTYPEKKKFHRLWGMRCYLCGAMDREEDHGVAWREEMSSFLEKFGIIVLNPCDKPIDLANELDDSGTRLGFKYIGDYEKLSKMMKTIRIVDLRMVDMSDFIICKIDSRIHTCGTYEEISWANRMKHPILIWACDGREKLPDWLWGMIPYQHVFDNMDGVKRYLMHVHMDENVDHLKRWMFFDFTKIAPKVSVEKSTKGVM